MIYNINVALPNSEIGQKIIKHTQDVYKEVYNANINPNPDEFIYLENDGEIYASFGLTYRENKKLFSECYLDTPLEKEEHAFGDLVSCEVGSCVSLERGFGFQLYKLLPYILYEKGISHALVTLTSKVKIIFDRLHFNTTYLNDAAEDRVPVKNIWGSFYQTYPKTFVMNVQSSLTDISLKDYARKLDIQINQLGRVLGQDLHTFYNKVSKHADIPYHALIWQKAQENLLNLQTITKGHRVRTYKSRKPRFAINALIIVLSLLISNNVSAGKLELELAVKGVKKAMHIAKNLLVVTVSPDLNNSQSRALSQHFVKHLEGCYPKQYMPVYRDLAKKPIPYIKANTLEVITGGTATTRNAKVLKALSDTLIEEIENSDAMVIATPMHNFTVPAPLKAYFDIVLRAGKTFKYTPNGPVGMLEDRPVMLISSSGGRYHGTKSDFLTPYIRHVLNFIGINNFSSVAAEGLAMQDQRKPSLLTAREKLEKYVEVFHHSQKILRKTI